MWHGLKSKKSTGFAWRELVAGLVMLMWAGVFLFLALFWGFSIIYT